MTVSTTVLIAAKTAENAQTGCWEWRGSKCAYGYGTANRNGRLIKRHRIAYCEAHDLSLDDIANKIVRHKCDNRSCINPAHLELGTTQDNTRDRHQRGRDARGETNGMAKLTEGNVHEIRRRYKPWSKTDGALPLAKQFGVSRSLIGQIISGAIWRHV